MEWVRNNRFLAVFIGIMVIGIGVLGYLVNSSYSHYAQVDEEYTSQVAELKRLQALQPFPEEANLVKYNQQKAAYGEAVTQFQTKLASMEPPPADKPLSPSDFQNRLRESVRDIGRSAQQVGVALPEGFYMGFEQYRESLPDTAATPLLTSQIDAIEQMVRILIKRRVDRINFIKRAALEQEGSAALTAASAAPPNPAMAKATAAAAPELITRHPIEISFAAAPSAFREALNEIVESPRLFVVRALQVKNQVDKGPVRGAGLDANAAAGTPGAPTQPTTDASGQPLPEKGPPPLRYIAGQEKVDVLAYIELTKVAPPR
jgi:LAS superfamily LD-carboxypeptidase LdcB